MDDDLTRKAAKKVAKKLAFYQCVVVFSTVSIVLLMLSAYLPSIAFWLLIPIPIFLMIIGLTFVDAYGLPVNGKLSEDWEAEAIEAEVAKMRRQRPVIDDEAPLSQADQLELKELERLQEKWTVPEDYV